MSGSALHVFQEEPIDDDDDDIPTDSTDGSDQRDEYNVKAIRAERKHPENGLEYLVDWEGYPLYRATWEPKENITSDLVLREWKEAQKAIRMGRQAPFDVEKWNEAIEEYEEAADRRRALRRKKRIKRGISVSPHSSDEDVQQQESPRKRVKQPIVQRKGLAHRVTKKRHVQVSESSSDEEDANMVDEQPETSPPDSLLMERDRETRRQSPAIHLEKTSHDPKSSVLSERFSNNPTYDLVAKRLPKSGTQREPPIRKPSRSAARKSAPVTAGGSRSLSETTGQTRDIMANWSADKQKKGRPRVSGEMRKDSMEAQFNKLSQQNRFQKYCRNEPAPDLNALAVVNPKTGQMTTPKIAPSTNASSNPSSRPLLARAVSTSTIDTAYHRRSPSPRSRQRSFSPRQTDVVLNAAGPRKGITEVCWFWQNHFTCKYPPGECPRAHWPIDSNAHAYVPNKQKTCYYWHTQGSCNKTEEDCPFAHQETGIVARPPLQQSNAPNRHVSMKDQTCHFWRHGRCDKPEHLCNFAHYDTGIYSAPPGLHKRGVVPSFAGTVPPLQSTSTGDEGASLVLDTSGPTEQRNNSSLSKASSIRRDTSDSTPALVHSPAQVEHPLAKETTMPIDQGWTTRQDAGRRRPSAMASSIEATLMMQSEEGETSSRLSVYLEAQDVPKLTKLVGSHPTLDVVRMVMANDFQEILWDEQLRARSLSIGSVVIRNNETALQNIIELCQAHVSGLVATVAESSSIVLLYPSSAEEWRFLETSGVPLESPLRFYVFEELPSAAANLHESTLPSHLEAQSSTFLIGKYLAGLDVEQLVPINDQIIGLEHSRASGDLHQERAWPVFLMFPETHDIELEVFTVFFQGLGCKVYSSETAGAWSYFRKKYDSGSLVVIHPETPLWRIPGLFDMIHSRGGKVRLFLVGVDKSMALLEGRQPRFQCQRLFPHGSVTFITDDIFVRHPEKALEVIQAFWTLNKPKPEGARFEKIAARPGLKEWLLKLAEEKAAERGSKIDRNNVWMKIYEAILHFCPFDAEDDDMFAIPETSSLLVSVSPDLLPSFRGLWEKDEAAATDMMVEWFAGWSIMHVRQYRKFVVCHYSERSIVDKYGWKGTEEETDPRGWATKYQHLGVLSPKDVVAMFTKEPKRKDDMK